MFSGHIKFIFEFWFQWNMVCDRRWMLAVAQITYMFGVFTGAVTLGSLADK